MQQLKPLSRQVGGENRYARDVATGPVQARYDAELDRVNAGQEGDRNCRGRRLGGKCCRDAGSGYHGYLTTNQIGRQGRLSIVTAVRPMVFDGDVLALDIAGFVEAASEWRQADSAVGFRGSGAEIADHRHRLLRERSQRPSECRRGANQRDQLTAQHAQDTGETPVVILIGARRSVIS